MWSTPPAATGQGRDGAWCGAPGLLVALGAGTATAHGLYQVVIAADVPLAIPWLDPLITDGAALVAYEATTRLHDAGRGFGWSVVILAAGLSGLAQATHLAGTVAAAAPVGLRIGSARGPPSPPPSSRTCCTCSQPTPAPLCDRRLARRAARRVVRAAARRRTSGQPGEQPRH